MYQITASNQFLKDLKRLKKRSISDFNYLHDFINTLANKGAIGLERRYRAHKLSGNYNGYWECHTKSDLLLIWKEDIQGLKIELGRTGTHSDLFE